MKKIVLVLLVVMTSCLKHDPPIPKVVLERPLWMHQFCLSAPSDTLKSEKYYYKNDRLVKKEGYQFGKQYSETNYQYNIENKIELEETHSRDHIERISYFYNLEGLLERKEQKIIWLDSVGQPKDSSAYATHYLYSNNLLIQENYHWGGKTTFEYRRGQVSKKVDHNSSGNPHHITHYEYLGENIIRLKKETAGGNLMHDMRYVYDNKFRLTSVIDQGQVIESNQYDNFRLMEKKEFYHGIDPGFFPCQGNYLFRFEY